MSEQQAKNLFLMTAFRNEENSLPLLLKELTDVLSQHGLSSQTTLLMINDFSTDNSVEKIESFNKENPSLNIEICSLETNLGNQGAMAFGLKYLSNRSPECIISFDSDGEDDLQKIPLLIEMAREKQDHVIFTERGNRHNTLPVLFLFHVFVLVIRLLTSKTLLPNNFMVLPGKYVKAACGSPFLPAYYSLSIFRLNLPYQSIKLDRRPRIYGKSSQNIYNLITHGLVGLLIFHETVIAKIYSWLVISVLFFTGTCFFALFVKFIREKALPGWTAMFMSINFGFVLLSLIMLCFVSALSLIFKVGAYQLSNSSQDISTLNKL